MIMLWGLLFLSVAITCCLSQGDSTNCSLPKKATEDCICVPLYLCVDGEIVTDGSNVIDPRKRPGEDAEELPLDEKYVPPECGPFHICCRNPESSKVTPIEIDTSMVNPIEIDTSMVTPIEIDTFMVTPIEIDTSIVTPIEIDTSIVTPIEIHTSMVIPVEMDTYMVTPIEIDTSMVTPIEIDTSMVTPIEIDTSMVTHYDHKCGNRNPVGLDARILTPSEDGEAQFGQWPWQAAILKNADEELSLKCGGTLIDDKHIITVAHCVDKSIDNKKSMVVRLGEWDRQNIDEFMPHEDYGVQDIFIHSQYTPNNLHNDIAVVKLNETVQFKPHIDTACLPQDDDDFTGQQCIATGFGTNEYKQDQFSLVLKAITLPVISNEDCQALLRKTRLGPRFKLHDGFLCAGGEAGQDACKGDGGGPLVCLGSDNSYTVAGLVSWGIDCGGEDVPGVYTDVKKFIDFIISKTQKPIEEYQSS